MRAKYPGIARRRKSRFVRKALLSATGALLAGTASAADGVLEINQACAVQTGCFAGDTAGFPVTIGPSSGSYVLTSDLVVDNSQSAIDARFGDGITLDLHGFQIRGPVSCTITNGIVSCSGGFGGTSGIHAPFANRITVRNGKIIGFGGSGLVANRRAEIRGVHTEQTSDHGISVGEASIVEGCSARLHEDTGIIAGKGSHVARNISALNRAALFARGIWGKEGSTVVGNISYGNTGSGIFAEEGSVVSDNTAFDNAEYGIEASSGGSKISGNTVYGNERGGIYAGDGSLVRENTVRLNTGRGLRLLLAVAYSDNVLVDNSAGPVIGGSNTGGNYCAGAGTISATCP